MHVHAEDTHLLKIDDKTEEELLEKMDRKDRYLITRAKKEGVIIKNENSLDQIEKLIIMHQNHAKREN
jgi:lipid II:glycine glycyltransferase (peptidoglycan interpeptide bridge formation enzyme)